MRHRGDSNGERRKRKTAAPKNRVMMLSAVFGLVALAVIGATSALWMSLRPKRVPVEAQADHESQVRVASRFPSPSREQALDLVRRAIATRDSQTVGSLFRDGDARSAEILDFLKGLETTDGCIERYDWLSSMDMNELLVEGVLVVFRGREKPGERIAFLTPDSAGNWRMDFDAFARTVSPSWRELLGNAVEGARVRVVACKDVYYNGPFGDESRWACYGIASLDTEEILHGYCRVGSSEADAMKKLFSEGESMSRVTLELRRVKGAESRQFEISRVLAKDWILPTSAGRDS